MCEPKALASKFGRDLSWVPIMRPGEALKTFANYPQMHNSSDLRFEFIDSLRAQHFVKAFEAGGEHGKRLYEKDWDRKVQNHFTQEVEGLSWAIPLLRPEQ